MLLLLLFFGRGRLYHLFGGGLGSLYLKCVLEKISSTTQITIIIIRISRQFPHHKENQPFFHFRYILHDLHRHRYSNPSIISSTISRVVSSFIHINYCYYYLFILFFIYCQLWLTAWSIYFEHYKKLRWTHFFKKNGKPSERFTPIQNIHRILIYYFEKFCPQGIRFRGPK